MVDFAEVYLIYTRRFIENNIIFWCGTSAIRDFASEIRERGVLSGSIPENPGGLTGMP